jgi:dTMP kinase
MMKHNGIFIVFEGLNCSGKTTQMELLADKLWADPIRDERSLLTTSQPGATADSHERFKWKKAYGMELTIADYIRDRLYHSPCLEEALHRGDIVLCSRYTASTVAYQGNLDPDTIAYIRSENDRVTHGLVPDLVVFMSITPSESLMRLKERNRPGDADFTLERLREIKTGYAWELNYCKDPRQIRLDQKEWLVVDGTAPIETTADRILAAVKELIKSKSNALP